MRPYGIFYLRFLELFGTLLNPLYESVHIGFKKRPFFASGSISALATIFIWGFSAQSVRF